MKYISALATLAIFLSCSETEVLALKLRNDGVDDLDALMQKYDQDENKKDAPKKQSNA